MVIYLPREDFKKDWQYRVTSKAKSLGMAVSAISLAALTCALYFAGPALLQQMDDILWLVALATVGIGLDWYTRHMDQDTTQCGYINPGLYLSFVPLTFPISDTITLQQRFGQAIIILSLQCFVKVLTHGLVIAMLYSGVNVLRLLTAGGAFLGVTVAMTGMNGRGLAATVTALFINYIFEKTVTNYMVNAAEDTDNQVSWQNVQARFGRLLPAQVLLGLLTASFAQDLMTEMAGERRAAAAAAAVLSSLLAWALHSTLWSSVDELQIKNQQDLLVELRKAQYNLGNETKLRTSLELELEKKSTELELIYEMARLLGASTNLADTMQIVQSMIRKLRIPYQSCVIYLYKSGSATPGQALSPALADTPYREVLEMSPLLQLQEPMITQVLHDQRTHMNPDVTASSEQRIFKEERSVICVPLVVRKENVGVIYVGSVNPRTHRDEHQEKLKMLAAYAAPSIKTALLFENKEQDLRSERQIRETVEAKNRQLAILQKLGQAIGATLKSDNTLKVVADSLQQMLPQAQSFIVFATNPDEEHSLKAEFANSPYADYIRNLPMRNDEGLLGNATKRGTTLLVPDTQAYDPQNVIINSERSVIIAPLTAESDIMGYLYVGAPKENTFTEEHRSLVETVSYQAAIALKNARLYEQTQQMALTDGLTGLLTHRSFQIRLSEETEWANRNKKPLCLIMVDTDKFKLYNDTLGHPAGDTLLKEIAVLLKDKVSSGDIVCRIGGDEFALILKDSPKERALATAERIRETFQLRFAAHQVQVTASVGVASYPSDASDKKDLLVATDEAMYFSKRNGRNRVTASENLEERRRRGAVEIEALPR